MNKRQFLRILSGGGALMSATVLGACVAPLPPPPGYAGPDYDYYYYPDANVYYGIATGYYFYPYRRRWIRSRVLPRHYRLRQRHRRPLRIGSPHPYRQNRDHRRRYRLAPARRRRARRHRRG